MKITSVDSFVLTVPTPKPMALNYAQQKLVVAEISTDEGVKGLGYSLVFGGGGAESVHAYLESRLAPVLIGEDPLFVERLWERMFRADMGIKKQGVAAYALSALDIGLWDIAGKMADLPLYQLWGAVTDRIPAYGSGGWARYSVEDLMVDVNQRLDVPGNVRQAALLEDLDLVWYEEPVLADDIAACAEVAEKIRIPVATGENNYTRYEFRELIERRAARYLMPDVCRANGYSETLRIGRLAAAHQIKVSPHVVHELSLHVAAALPNAFLVEWIDWVPADLFEGMPKCEDGAFRISDRPGHGIALRPDAEKKYRLS